MYSINAKPLAKWRSADKFVNFDDWTSQTKQYGILAEPKPQWSILIERNAS
jgi:hypothetical protein